MAPDGAFAVGNEESPTPKTFFPTLHVIFAHRIPVRS